MVAYAAAVPLRESLLTRTLARLELVRLRVHFRRVERELGSANLEGLTPELRRARAENLARLHSYAARGVFPRNTDEPRRRIPYFKDCAGTHCAVAHLIAGSGRQDIVNAVAASDNHVYVDDLHEGPVVDWIRGSGLTRSEVALIQPTYCWDQCAEPVSTKAPVDPASFVGNLSAMRIVFLICMVGALAIFGYVSLAWARRRGRKATPGSPTPADETVAATATE